MKKTLSHLSPSEKNLVKKFLKAAIHPGKWIAIIKRSIENKNRGKFWSSFDTAMKSELALSSSGEGPAILAEGFWDNANHFFRLRIFLGGIDKSKRKHLAALLRTPEDRARKTLSSMGFTSFFFLSDFPIISSDYKSAEEHLIGVKSHLDLLRIKLPDNFPSYIFYDTVLKSARHPQPDIKSEFWRESIADIYRLKRFYDYVFNSINVSYLVLSHPYKNEFGMALTYALRRNISCFNIYATYEMMRIKRFDNLKDFLDPMESLTYKDYLRLDEKTRKSIENAGKKYLRGIETGKNTDINVTRAYQSQKGKIDLYKKYSINKDNPIAVVFCHAWYDFPHAFGMENFTDFLDWINTTLKTAKSNPKTTWIFKPHPCDSWYGDFTIKNLTKNLPENIHIIDESVSVTTALEVADFAITVHGTVAMEATAKGVPVICADRSWYSDWDFVEVSNSKDDFINILNRMDTKPKEVTQEMIGKAATCAYLVLSPGEEETKILRLVADHIKPSRMFNDLINLIYKSQKDIEKQSKLIEDWIKSESKSFCIHHKLKLHKELSNKTNGL